MTTALQALAAEKAKDGGFLWPKMYRYPNELKEFVKDGTWPDRWGPKLPALVPEFEPGGYGDSLAGMAVQILEPRAGRRAAQQHSPHPAPAEVQASSPSNVHAAAFPDVAVDDDVPFDVEPGPSPRRPDLPRVTGPSPGHQQSPSKPKKKKNKKGGVPIEGGKFVPIIFEELESAAYMELTGTSAKLYCYLKRAARTAASNGGGGREREVAFDYTYSEAKTYGFSESTFIRAMKDLWAKGFIEVIERGGLRGKGRTNSRYKLSALWKTYGKVGGWKDRARLQEDPFASRSEPKKGDVKW